jgi:hypothetical protein
MTLPLLSQKPSSDSIKCVPVSALRNAMIMKTEFDKTKVILSDCRDSISILNNVVLSQDSLILTKENKIQVLSDNIVNYKEIVSTKDDIISIKDKEIKHFKKQRNVGYGVGVLSILLSLLLVL